MLRLYDVRYIMNLWIRIILFEKKKKSNKLQWQLNWQILKSMTTKVTAIFALIKPYHANMNYFQFFAVIIKSYKNVYTKLKDCIIPIAELTKTLLPDLLKTKLLAFCRSTRI